MSKAICLACSIRLFLYLDNSKYKSSRAFARLRLTIIFNSEAFIDEPNIRNSNLFPVKATGEVLLRSESSIGKEEIVCILNEDFFEVFFVGSKYFSTSSLKYIETIAGGASEAPKRKSLPGLEENNLIKSEYSSTPFIKEDKKIKNTKLSLFGSNRFNPVSVINE